MSSICIVPQIMSTFHVMPKDQHLKTVEGVKLSDNEATLADLAILPDTLILAKVSILKLALIHISYLERNKIHNSNNAF